MSLLGFCRVHLTHHIWFALVKFLCVLWTGILALLFMAMSSGRAAGQESCYPSRLTPTETHASALRQCLSMVIRISGKASAFDMRLGDAGQKVFALISFFCSLLLLFFMLFAFHFSVFIFRLFEVLFRFFFISFFFGFFRFYFFFALQLANASRLCGGRQN